MLTRALAVAILPLVATQNCDIVAPPPPTREETCLASYTTWGVPDSHRSRCPSCRTSS